MTASPSELRAAVLTERAEPEARQIAAALARAIGGEPVPPERAEVAIVLDADALERARAAGAKQVVAFVPYLGWSWEGSIAEADGVIVAHPALVDEAVSRGASRERVKVGGPVAPEGYAPSDARLIRESLSLAIDRPVVIVRGTVLEDLDLPVALVQLSLVAGAVQLLFDVGVDVELAARLRREAGGYGLEAWMFAETDDAPKIWQACDAVLGRIGGPETARALAVGAALLATPPRSSELRFARLLEESGIAEFADAPATLAVSIESMLRPESLQRARAAIADLAVAGGAARVVTAVRELRDSGARALASGLPRGLERIGQASPARAQPTKPAEDLDRRVDEELEELRRKLGMK